MDLPDITRITDARTRSISAENPSGAKAAGARAKPGDDEHCTPAAADLGRGWKVRPCLRNFEPGRTFVLADIEGPGVIQHIWITVLRSVHRWIRLEVFYDDSDEPSICTPLGDFFANGIDGRALISSMPIAVNPLGGMNSYWPMPFRKRIRIQVTNDGPETISEFFFQITYAEQEVADDAGYLHASWRRSITGGAGLHPAGLASPNPEHIIADTITGRGHYAGTYLVWNQLSAGWWGEGEVKFFIDGDPHDPDTGDGAAPTICGTGTEDYFGGAWGFVMDHERDMRPTTYTTPYLGYPQAVYEADRKLGPRPPAHALYRWHIPDPIRFQQDLRVTVQALGWWPNRKFQPLADDIASVAYWYQDQPAGVGGIGPVEGRFPR